MQLDDIRSAIAGRDDDSVEQFLFECLDRQYGRAKLQASDYSFALSFPQGYRMLSSTTWIEAEVSNGGVEQFFWNRLVDYHLITADAIRGYEMIGADAQALAVRECLRAFAPLETVCRRIKENLRSDGFPKWQDKWDALNFGGDAPLFCYEMVTTTFRVPWIRRNPELFVFSGSDGRTEHSQTQEAHFPESE